MSRAARVYLVTCAALVGFALAYALPPYTSLPNLFYDAVHRRYLWGNRPEPTQLGYFGQILYGFAGALVAGLAAFVATARRRKDATESTKALAAAWALAFLVLVGAYFTWQNWP